MGARPWTAAAGGLLLDVRLTPKGGRDALDGIAPLADGRAVLKARVRAAPHEGAANRALIRLIAGTAGVPASKVDVIRGGSGRDKVVAVGGIDRDRLLAALGAPPPGADG